MYVNDVDEAIGVARERLRFVGTLTVAENGVEVIRCHAAVAQAAALTALAMVLADRQPAEE